MTLGHQIRSFLDGGSGVIILVSKNLLKDRIANNFKELMLIFKELVVAVLRILTGFYSQF